ncbi:DUF3231 family protein [Salibacterium salarium]|uniref:DUF3231 family protein n=1 Tax=Salibacterium salarium TaxID=284579 RepID=A0A3R9QNW0_9BACI|nr:DUF3231 family protein [Salibacterium salarium]RSL34997.1 DUF3231 family protein [Salibacterium salarium]
MGILSGNPQEEPMHYGEVFGAWTYLTSLKGIISGYQTMMNHTGDADLFKFIENMVDEAKREEMEMEQLLKENGVGLPPSPPERAYSDHENIPVGARFNDPEISAMITKDIATGLVACSQVMGQSTREDIAMMFGRYHSNKAQAGAKLLQLNKDKGWLVSPPLHIETPQSVTV